MSYPCVGIEVLTEVVIKSSFFRDITPCSPLKFTRYFGGTFCLYLQGRRTSPKKTSVKQVASRGWRQHVPPKRWLIFKRLHSVISRKIEIFISYPYINRCKDIEHCTGHECLTNHGLIIQVHCLYRSLKFTHNWSSRFRKHWLFTFDPLEHVPLICWRYRLFSFIYGDVLQKLLKCNQNRCIIFEKIIIIRLEAAVKGPYFWSQNVLIHWAPTYDA
jgi:hypothetical protein